jgi:hypothetical protein
VSDSLEPSPIGAILKAVRAQLPTVDIERTQSTDPLANENVWFIRWNGTRVSIASRRQGQPPFLIDRYGKDRRVTDPAEATDLILNGLVTEPTFRGTPPDQRRP